MTRTLAIVLLSVVAALPAGAENWPAFRGPTGQGLSGETDLPLKWDRETGVRWKVELPDAGNSSPIVWGDRVFITQASQKTKWPPHGYPSDGGPAIAEKRSVMCFRRSDGRLLWQRDTIHKQPELTHIDNPFCSATPTTDGQRVIAFHGAAGLVCYDMDGRELWKRDAGPIEHIWGNASSPVIHGDLVYLWRGPGENHALLALDKRTGETVWEHHEPDGTSQKAGENLNASWSTQVIARVGGREQVILAVPHKLRGLDPMTGEELWSSPIGPLTHQIYNSPMCADGVAVIGAVAVRAGGQDTPAQGLWSHKNPAYISSGVIVDGRVYIWANAGVPRCFDLDSGEDLWDGQIKRRLAGPAFGSLVHAGGRLYITDREGTSVVFKAGEKFELLAVNKLDERTHASIAVSEGDLFIRTHEHLWCIGGE